METSISGSLAKEPSRNFLGRKANIFVAMPTLLTLYFIGAGIAFVICTRSFVSFHIFSRASQAPVQLFLVNSTYFPGKTTVLVADKGALEVLEELQAPPHSRQEECSVDISKADTYNASTLQSDFDLEGDQHVAMEADTAANEVIMEADTAENEMAVEADTAANEEAMEADTVLNEEEHDTEPEFMQMPAIKKNKQVPAAILQHRLKRMSSWERRRWLRQNWSIFNILKEDKISNQFNNRMREFFCADKQTPHLRSSVSLNPSRDEALKTSTLHKTDETSICQAPKSEGSDDHATNRVFCTQRFFLTWMSPVALFSPRERLGLESIFNYQPRACVVILSRTMDSNEGRAILSPFLARGYRVLAVTPELRSLFIGLPAARWLRRLRDGTGDPGCINLMQNLSNLMRLAVLHKYGGVYLDTDVIVLRSFAALRNAVGTQSRNTATGQWTRLNNAVLVFDRAHPMVLEFLREFANTFDGSRWGWNGPYLVSRVVDRVLQVQRWANCSDVTVVDMPAFYPVNWIDIVKFFQRPTVVREIKWQV